MERISRKGTLNQLRFFLKSKPHNPDLDEWDHFWLKTLKWPAQCFCWVPNYAMISGKPNHELKTTHHVAQLCECCLCAWTHPWWHLGRLLLRWTMGISAKTWISGVLTYASPEHPAGHAGGCSREQAILHSIPTPFPHLPHALTCENNRASGVSLHILVFLGEYKPACRYRDTRTFPYLRALTPPSRNRNMHMCRALKLLLLVLFNFRLFSCIQLKRQEKSISREFCNQSPTCLTSCRFFLKTCTAFLLKQTVAKTNRASSRKSKKNPKHSLCYFVISSNDQWDFALLNLPINICLWFHLWNYAELYFTIECSPHMSLFWSLALIN